MMATFMTAVENTIVATAMPTIVADLGDFHLFSWVFAVYLLAQAVSIPIYGRLADLYGRKRVFFVGAERVPAGLDALRLRPGHAVADRLPRPAGHRRRRRAAGGLHHRRRHLLADRARPRPGLPVERVRRLAAIVGPTLGAFLVEHAELVDRLLDQPADRRPRHGHAGGVLPRAAARHGRPASTTSPRSC